MYFNMKNYLKSTRNHTAKQSHNQLLSTLEPFFPRVRNSIFPWRNANASINMM
jgi:hypothetical protein